MKKYTFTRILLNSGCHLLMTVLFTAIAILYFKVMFTGISDSNLDDHEISLLWGASLAVILVFYQVISRKLSNLIKRMNRQVDCDEAISILEANGLKVGLMMVDLPKDQDNNELNSCIAAYAALKNQDIPFVLINQNCQISGKVFMIGSHAEKDHNKYKLRLER